MRLSHTWEMPRDTGRTVAISRAMALKQVPVPPGQFEPGPLDVLHAIVEGIPDQAALLDHDWTILVANDAWVSAVSAYRYLGLLPGSNYSSFCSEKAARGHGPASLAAAAIAALNAGAKSPITFSYEGEDSWKGHAFHVTLSKLNINGQCFMMATRREVTELLHLRQLRLEFGQALLQGQNRERRRLGREIHDSTLQLLVALGLSLGQLKRSTSEASSERLVADIERLLRETQSEIRSISYLAHPPEMNQLGLRAALRALCEGYSGRTSLKVTFESDLAMKLDLPDAEHALYRVVQEALSNVHRHAEASEALVVLTSRKSMLHVVICDNGVGIRKDRREGVGLPSMRERVSELGGRLSLREALPGTRVIASIPSPFHLAGHYPTNTACQVLP